MTGRLIYLFFFALCICHFSLAKDHGPVLIWNTNQSPEAIPSVSALQYMDYGNLRTKYLPPFKPNNILLFLMDALSMEDLTSHASELRHVKGWIEKSHFQFLPNVKEASHLIHDLTAHGYNVYKLDHDAGLDLKEQDNNLVVVELPSTLTNPSRRRALQKADEVMENVISKIGSQRDFTIVFAGMKASIDDRGDQFAERIRVSRSLQAAEDNVPGWHQDKCVRLFLRQNITLNLYDGATAKVVEIPENSTIVDNADCAEPDPQQQKLLSSYKNVDIAGTEYKVGISYIFAKGQGSSWYFSGAEVTLDADRYEFNLTTTMDQVPIGMSFSCSQKFVLVSDQFLTYKRTELVIERFQVQAFVGTDGYEKERFDSAWDCVGFFTVPIWCGILVTLLLVVILSIGMFMLSDIKTMDRFDDPKGQPILVGTSD